jgi:hypothetical protein
MSRLGLLLILLAGCELRGLTHGQLFGNEGADAASEEGRPDAASGAPDRPSSLEDVAAPAPDAPVAPPEGILITGFVTGVCDHDGTMVGGAGAHTCAYDGKGSYRLRVRNVAPGQKIEIGARRNGYLPDPDTATIILEPGGNIHDFHLRPASGTCAPPPDSVPCVCDGDAGCEPS